MGIRHRPSWLDTNGSRVYSVMAVTALWGAWWWRVSVRCHRVPQWPERLHILTASAPHGTLWAVTRLSVIPRVGESHAFATNFWSFQKFGGIDVYRLILKKKENRFMWVNEECLGSLNLPLTLKDVWQLWSSFTTMAELKRKKNKKSRAS